ncbi:MAG: META domain-containing protein [Deltaproteobacteria bacterium]|nr:META domain-containing protein [Deltaproteobacteria bacterium]
MRVVALLLLVLVAVPGCASKESPAPSQPAVPVPLADPLVPLSGTQWVLVDVGGTAMNAARTTLSFDGGPKVSGNGGCNTYSGGVRNQSGTILFGPIQTTRKACAAPIMAQETRYFDVLVGTRGLEVDGNALYFLDITSSRTAHFTKLP